MTQNQQGEKIKMSGNKSRTLTYDTLLNLGACSEYRERFNKRYPEGSVEITVELAVEQAGDWDWHWASGMINNRTEWYARTTKVGKQYAETLRPYSELLSSARGAGEKALDAFYEGIRGQGLSWDEYDRLGVEAQAQYQDSLRPAKAALAAVREIAQDARDKSYARIFAELYIAEGEAVGGASYEAPEQDPEEYYESDYEPCNCGCGN